MPASIRVVVLVLMAALGPAAAASDAAEVSVTDGVLRIQGTAADNELVVRPNGTTFVIDEPAEPLVAGPGCMPVTLTRATCTAFVSEIHAEMGAGDDVAGFWGVDVPITAAAKAGDDLVEGGTARDVLTGGDGNDGLNGRRDGDRVMFWG
jgi:Ca2+-binding RTX toxin-like protein